MRRVVAICFLVAGFCAEGGAAAQATTLHCGQTVTSNTTLGNNLTNCAGDGIDVGANGIQINLNGHVITAQPGSSQGNGVNFQGHDHVTVVGGPGSAVRNFGTGFLVSGAQDTVRQGGLLTSDNSHFGVHMTGPGDLLTGTRLFGYHQTAARTQADEVVAVDGPNERVDHVNVFLGGQAGIEVGGTGDTITKSTVVGGAYQSAPVLFGIVVNGPHATVAYNTIAQEVAAGISVRPVGQNLSVIQGNMITSSAVGVEVTGAGRGGSVTVADNQVRGPGQVGYRDANSIGDTYSGNVAHSLSLGFWVTDTSGTTLSDNLAGGPGVDGSQPPGNGGGMLIEGGTGTVIVGNNASNSTNDYSTCQSPFSNFPCVQDGIKLDHGPTHVTILNNTTNFNFGDGINDGSVSGTIRHNQADRNGRYGFEITGTITDGGHNLARDNALGQCVHLRCS